MERVLVLCLVACGAPAAQNPPQPRPSPLAEPTPAAPTPAAPTPAAPTPAAPTPAAPTTAPSSQIVDTSIAGVWNAHEPHVQAPLGPQPVIAPAAAPAEEPPVPDPVPRAHVPNRRAPCFANRGVLVATKVYQDLERYAVGMSSEDPPRGRYGTCTIEHGQLRDAKGKLLAELSCGMTVYVQGIIDDLGFEIGASGSDIAAHYPTHDTICWGYDDTHTRCWFTNDRYDESDSHYVVAGVLDKDDREPVRGAAARGFFTSRTVSSFTERMSCH